MATYSKCIEVSAGVKPCADKINRSTWISSHLEERIFFIKADLCLHNAKEMIYIIK